jgi:hypothetical protein
MSTCWCPHFSLMATNFTVHRFVYNTPSRIGSPAVNSASNLRKLSAFARSQICAPHIYGSVWRGILRQFQFYWISSRTVLG